MKVQVLGSGCPTCQKLHEAVLATLAEIDRDDIEVEYLTGAKGMQEMIRLGALSSPVLTVDGTIAMKGFTSDTQKIKNVILHKSQKK